MDNSVGCGVIDHNDISPPIPIQQSHVSGVPSQSSEQSSPENQNILASTQKSSSSPSSSLPSLSSSSSLGSSSKQSSGWPKRKRSTAIGVAVQGGDGDNAATTKKQKCAGNVVQKNDIVASQPPPPVAHLAALRAAVSARVREAKEEQEKHRVLVDRDEREEMAAAAAAAEAKRVAHLAALRAAVSARVREAKEEQEKHRVLVDRDEKKGAISMATGSSSSSSSPSMNSGRWTPAEKAAFLTGLKRFGRGKWKEIAKLIPTRSTVQVKTHAQMIMRPSGISLSVGSSELVGGAVSMLGGLSNGADGGSLSMQGGQGDAAMRAKDRAAKKERKEVKIVLMKMVKDVAAKDRAAKKAAAAAAAAEAEREEENAAWYRQQMNNCDTVWKDFFEDPVEQRRLDELIELHLEFLKRYNAEKNERKRECYIKGLTECSVLLAEYIMKVDDDGYDTDAKNVEGMLRREYTNMGRIGCMSGKEQKSYLLNLRRRKDARGRSDSEASRALWQKLQEKKKEFYAMREECQKELAEEFGKEAADRAAKILRACTDPNSEDIKGSWGGFTTEEAKKIAYRKTEQVLIIAANKYNLNSIDDFLPDNMSLKECLDMNREDKKELNRLREEAMKKSKERAAERAAKSGGDVKVEEKYVNMHGINSLISFCGILNYYDDIIDSLVDKKVAMIEHPDSDKPPSLFVTIPNELAEEKCIGREIMEKLGVLGDVKLTSYVKGTYVIELFSGEENIRVYKVTDDKITRVKLSIDTTCNLFTFCCALPRDTEHESEAKWKSNQKRWTLHRLKQVVYSNLGLGINNRKWFRDYFELKDDETFEDKFSYYEFDAEAAKKRYQRMKANGWENVELASQCDGDHMLGRLCMWMCESIFVLPCSHSWNQCMGKVRQCMGCWGFGFAHIEYNGGN